MGEVDVLDRQLIAELRDIMGPEFPVLVQAYLRDAEARMQELRTALGTLPSREDDAAEARDAESARRAAHTLKGSSSNLGAVRVTRLCAELEELARRRSPVQGTMLDELEVALEEAADALAALLQAAE